MCSCDEDEQSVDHILHEWKLSEHERDRLNAAVIWSENWPVSKDKLNIKFKKKNLQSIRQQHIIRQSSVCEDDTIDKEPKL